MCAGPGRVGHTLNSMNDDNLPEKVKNGVYVRRKKGPQTAALRQNRALQKQLPDDVSELIAPLLEQSLMLEISENTILFSFNRTPYVPKLPSHYFVKGGVARELLRGHLLPEIGFQRARDVDLIRFAGSSDRDDHRLSMKYMRDDYEFGRGVEVVENRPTYFVTRDLTVNEVLAGHGRLECSFQAIRDIKAGVIQPTPHVTDAFGDVLGATVMKGIRFLAEARVRGFPGRPEGSFFSTRVTHFDIALNLERSFAMSPAVAEEFILLAWQYRYLCPSYEAPPSAVDAIIWLAERIQQGFTLFKSLPEDVISELPAKYLR